MHTMTMGVHVALIDVLGVHTPKPCVFRGESTVSGGHFPLTAPFTPITAAVNSNSRRLQGTGSKHFIINLIIFETLAWIPKNVYRLLDL